MQTTRLKITGMSCEACVGHAKKAIEAVPGVDSVTVNLRGQQAVVEHDGADVAAIVAAVAEEGYVAQIEA